jgi:hypothetical protein
MQMHALIAKEIDHGFKCTGPDTNRDVKEYAAAALESIGLIVSDAVRILLTQTETRARHTTPDFGKRF